MSDCPTPVAPSLAGFVAFARNQGVTAAILPDGSIWFTYAFCVALEIVNEAINCASARMYWLAVMNLAMSNLINYAQDAAGAPPYNPNPPNNTDNTLPFFAYVRKQYNSLGFVSGVIQASADESTSQSLVVPEAFKDFTIANLQQLKDPYGRAYLGIAMDYGPAAWGLS